MQTMTFRIEDYIRDVPDFPKKGVVFKDISPLLGNAEAFKDVIDRLARAVRGKGITKVVSAESRGFIFGSALAYVLGAGFVMLRKPGKLPWKTEKQEFKTEYSTDAFEVHTDALKKGDIVVIVDDVLATGGTARAAIELSRRLKARVAAAMFILELEFLKGRSKLDDLGVEIVSLVKSS
ncbi:adenine phosphoribosyltransferase [Candidatus Woesearchaeota archaeon CG1_02_47_18]|nr:MAG: adenine phosphoribosyltransferase [Candidatus Woesearchaeota archaeon CG1_02_47_18]